MEGYVKYLVGISPVVFDATVKKTQKVKDDIISCRVAPERWRNHVEQAVRPE